MKLKPQVYVVIIVLVVAMLACSAPSGTPTPPAAFDGAQIATAVAGTQTALAPVPTNAPLLSTPEVAATHANPPAVDCQVRTFIKDATGMHEQEDPYIVMGEWTNGNATFETAKVCAAVQAKGGNSFDIIWDQDVDNVSFILNASMFTWAEIQQIGKDLGVSRIGIVQNHPSGRSSIDYDVANPNPLYGPVLYYHLYDRADWEANPLYHAPEMAIPTPGS